jgi:serine/threonine protein kinase
MASFPEEPQNHNQERTQQTANPVGQGTSPQTNSPIRGAKLPNFPPGLEIHNYIIMSLLGRGGMGVVYRAHHKILDKDLAIKFLKTESVDERAWERFKLEAKTLGRLRHRNLVGIHDLGLFQDTFPYYVMDLLDGESLFDLVRRVGPLTEKEVVEIFIQAAAGLACAHENGILHRDVKPANIVVTWAESNMSPVVKVVDFGLAKLVESNQSLTKTGEVNGSPLYMSPEQCEAGKLDERTDIYSLGCSMYEALTARVPFLGSSAFETMLMHQQDEPPTLAEQMPDLTFSPEIEAIIAKMLTKNKERRYQKMTQVIGDLRTLDAKAKQKLHPGKQTSAIKDLEEIEEELEQSKREKSAKFKVFAMCSFLGLLLLGTGGYFLNENNQKLRTQDELRKSRVKVTPIEEQLPKLSKYRVPQPNSSLALFKFPDMSIGRIRNHDGHIFFENPESSGYPRELDETDARGEIKCVKSYKNRDSIDLEFQPDAEMLSHPEIMKCFQACDLQRLVLSKVASNTSEFLSASTHLKEIKELECPGMQAADLKLLENFPELKNLTLNGTLINGAQLVELKKITTIEVLSYRNPMNIDHLLEALQYNSKIRELDLSSNLPAITKLTGKSVKLLAKLTPLKTIKLSNSNVTAEMLAQLSALTNVATIELLNCKFNSHTATEALLKWKRLKRLTVNTNTFSASDKERLIKKGIKISDTAAGVFQEFIDYKVKGDSVNTEFYLDAESESENKHRNHKQSP